MWKYWLHMEPWELTVDRFLANKLLLVLPRTGYTLSSALGWIGWCHHLRRIMAKMRKDFLTSLNLTGKQNATTAEVDGRDCWISPLCDLCSSATGFLLLEKWGQQELEKGVVSLTYVYFVKSGKRRKGNGGGELFQVPCTNHLGHVSQMHQKK